MPFVAVVSQCMMPWSSVCIHNKNMHDAFEAYTWKHWKLVWKLVEYGTCLRNPRLKFDSSTRQLVVRWKKHYDILEMAVYDSEVPCAFAQLKEHYPIRRSVKPWNHQRRGKRFNEPNGDFAKLGIKLGADSCVLSEPSWCILMYTMHDDIVGGCLDSTFYFHATLVHIRVSNIALD